MLRPLVFSCAFVLFWISYVLCENACEFSNIDLKEVVSGIEGKVEASDPLHKESVEGEIPGFKYALRNITFNGLKDAEVIHMQCDTNKKNQLTFQYFIKIPLFFITYDYDADGKINSLLIEGHGIGNVKAIDYVLMITGIYDTVVGSDHISRPIVKEHTLDTDPRGGVSFVVKNLFHGDRERGAKVNQFLNENWKAIEKLNMKSPVVSSMVKSFIDNLNSYAKVK